ncbi:AAA family ATPase [Vibrio parahaemolyticus]|nr:AAA family ATPase [Vibrio parahaemolyticus]
MKKFYNRQSELSELTRISENIETTFGQLSVLVGKRRVGKTRLLKEAFGDNGNNKTLYFFISRKSEAMLVHEFAELIASELNAKFFKPESLRDIFEFLLDYSTQTPVTIIVDEFQDIERVNPSLFSDIQNLWDSYKATAKMHLVCCGSMYNMMTKIFKEKDEPLMNRDDRFFHIKPLKPSFIKEIMTDLGLYNSERMLEWWCLTGGIPKYLEWLSLSTGCESIFDYVISGSSPFMKEGTHRLVEDFGSEHQGYFDILNAISRGKTKRSDIQNYVGSGVDVHLERLELNFNVITKMKPISSKESARDSRFEIEDPFLKFWFKFIHSNSSAVEMDNFDYIKSHIERDFKTFSGWQLEGLYKAILAESKMFNKIGGYWNPKGTDEIDIVAINDLEKKVLIAECKRQQSRYDEAGLVAKSQSLISKMKLHNYEIMYRGFSLDNLDDVMKEFAPA